MKIARRKFRKRALEVVRKISAQPHAPSTAEDIHELAVLAARTDDSCASVFYLGLRSFWRTSLDQESTARESLDEARSLGTDCLVCQAEIFRRESYIALSSGTRNHDTAALRAAVTTAEKARELYDEAIRATAFNHFSALLRWAEGSALIPLARARFHLGEDPIAPLNTALRLTLPAREKSLVRDELLPCLCLPAEENRHRLHTNAYNNLAIALAHSGRLDAITESRAMLSTVRRSYGPRDHLPRAKVDWLAGKLTAATWPGGPELTPQQRQDRQRMATRQLSRGVRGLLAHGSPADALMCLLDLCALPWIRKPEEEILTRFNSRDPVQQAQFVGHLEALDPRLASKVDALRECAQSAAAEIRASEHQAMNRKRRVKIAATAREHVSIRLHRTMRWLVAAGALPPVHPRAQHPRTQHPRTQQPAPQDPDADAADGGLPRRRRFAFGW